jgi:hypothetical protein
MYYYHYTSIAIIVLGFISTLKPKLMKINKSIVFRGDSDLPESAISFHHVNKEICLFSQLTFQSK